MTVVEAGASVAFFSNFDAVRMGMSISFVISRSMISELADEVSAQALNLKTTKKSRNKNAGCGRLRLLRLFITLCRAC